MTLNVLAISGSLRRNSINSALCRAAARLAPASMKISVYTGMGTLPLFNPDLEAHPPDTVQAFRLAITQADALLIASPEYAHGITGVMKNALDWLVSHEGTVYKPIALINTSPRAHHAHESLREVLQTMSTHLIAGASIAIPLMGFCVTEEAMISTPEVRRAIEGSLEALSAHLTGQSEVAANFPLG